MTYVQLCLQQGMHGHCGLPIGHKGPHSWEPRNDDEAAPSRKGRTKTPGCPMCLGGPMVATTDNTWRCPCGASLTFGFGHPVCPVHGVTNDSTGECAVCRNEGYDEENFHDCAILQSIDAAARSLLYSTPAPAAFTAAELAEHALQIAGEITARRRLMREAAKEGPDPKRLDTELALLRTIAHGTMGLVNLAGEPGSCADHPEIRQQIARFLSEWIADYEGPRVGVTKDSIPPGTELVDLATSLRGKWRPHT